MLSWSYLGLSIGEEQGHDIYHDDSNGSGDDPSSKTLMFLPSSSLQDLIKGLNQNWEKPKPREKKEGEQPYLDGGAEKWRCTSPWFSSRHQPQGRGGRRRPRVGQGAALGRRDGARRQHAGEDEGANRGGDTLGKRSGASPQEKNCYLSLR
jgi:hypothetical protein